MFSIGEFARLGAVSSDQLGISGLVNASGPFMLFYQPAGDHEITVNVALPVAGESAELPPPARYRVLPAAEVAAAVRSGPAASIYPMIYQDLAAWVHAHGYQPHGPGRDIWIHEVDDISEADQQVFESQLPFTRPAAGA